MHRLLRRRGTSGDRRAHAVHPARKKPELLAVAPNQVWSWDITGSSNWPVAGMRLMYGA
jgi:putative transposase